MFRKFSSKNLSTFHLGLWPSSISLLVLIIFLSTYTIGNYRDQITRLTNESLILVKWKLSRLQRTLEIHHRADKPAGKVSKGKHISLIAEFEKLAVLDENNEVIYSKHAINNLALLGFIENEIGKLPSGTARHNISPSVFYNSEKSSIYAYYPVFLQLEEGGTRPSKVGLIVCEYDLSAKRAQIFSDTLSNSLFVALIALAAVASITYVLWNKVIFPIRHLCSVAAAIQTGTDYSTTDIKGRGELAELSRSINDIGQCLQKSTSSAGKSQLRLQEIIENFPSLISIADTNNQITVVNQKTLDTFNTFGKKNTDYVGKTITDILPGPESEKLLVAEKKVLTTGKPVNCEVSWTNYNKDVKNYGVVCFPLKDEDNTICAICNIATDLTQYRSALQQATEAEAKNVFLSTTCDKIHTPISGIVGAADLLLNSPLNSEQKKLLATLKISSQALLTIINDIVDYSKIGSDKLQLNKEPFSPYKIITDCTALFQQQLDEKEIDFTISIEPKLRNSFQGNPWMLKYIMLNLLNNAVKFTNKGRISVETQCLETQAPNVNSLRCVITDTGIGMTEQQQHNALKELSQADSAITQACADAGPGLAIAKNDVNLMGGSIDINSELGKGSVVTLTINLGKTTALLHEKKEPKQQKDPDMSHVSVLVVEDNDVNTIIVQRLLKLLNIVPRCVTDGKQAVDLLSSKEASFDVIFMDCEMPVMDGYTATQLIRRHERENRLKPTLIVALTAQTAPEHVQHCLDSGMNYHLPKPVKKSDLLNIVEMSIEYHFKQSPSSEPLIQSTYSGPTSIRK